jgi:hypothetical protein
MIGGNYNQFLQQLKSVRERDDSELLPITITPIANRRTTAKFDTD